MKRAAVHCCLLLWLASYVSVRAEVWVYDVPGGGEYVSPDYEVTVVQEAESCASTVLYSHGLNEYTRYNHDMTPDATVTYNDRGIARHSTAKFSFTGTITVRCKVLPGAGHITLPLTSAKVLPSSYDIPCTIENGDTIVFTLDRPEKVAVIANYDTVWDRYVQRAAGHVPIQNWESDYRAEKERPDYHGVHLGGDISEGFKNPLVVLAQGPEVDVPSKTDPGTLVVAPGTAVTQADLDGADTVWFEPGVHDLSALGTAPWYQALVKQGQTVYLEGGSYVKARFRRQGAFAERQVIESFDIAAIGSHDFPRLDWTPNANDEDILRFDSGWAWGAYTPGPTGATVYHTPGNAGAISWYKGAEPGTRFYTRFDNTTPVSNSGWPGPSVNDGLPGANTPATALNGAIEGAAIVVRVARSRAAPHDWALLVRDSAGWWQSNGVEVPYRNSGAASPDPVYFRFGDLTWTALDPASPGVIDMDQVDDGGEGPIALGDPGMPDLSAIEGLGFICIESSGGQTAYWTAIEYVVVPPGAEILPATIRGRGTISGLGHRWITSFEEGSQVIGIDNLTGVSITDRGCFGIYGGKNIDDIAMLGAWYGNTDGPDYLDDCTIRNSFLMAHDDNLKLNNNTRARHIVIWQAKNAHAIMVKEMRDHIAFADSVVEDVDILAYYPYPTTWKHPWGRLGPGAISCILGNDINVSSFTFRDIRIESPYLFRVFSFFNLDNRANYTPAWFQWFDPTTEEVHARLSGFTFENITVNSPMIAYRSLIGSAYTGSLRDFRFYSLTINGTVVTDQNRDTFFEIQYDKIDGLSFSPNRPPRTKTGPMGRPAGVGAPLRGD